MKKWTVRRPNEEFSKTIMRETEAGQLCADVLASRGFENGRQAAEKLSADSLSDPFQLKDMREAAAVISKAVDGFERICIYGDYDCDGVTSTVMLFSYLELMGADVTYYIPERSEGYGLNKDAVRKLADMGVKLIITVDNGISAIEEAELIYQLGMRLVVTDHHQVGEQLPKAEAIVDPHRNDCPSIFKNLCGAGVVLKLMAALEDGSYDTVFDEYGELAALATVADIVELSSENRYIVRRGMKLMENSERLGMTALIKQSGVKFPLDSTAVAFGLAPRINASGRFGSPSLAAKLLLTEDEDEAEVLAQELDKLNNERKKTENDIVDAIGEYINSDPTVLSKRVLVLSGENWHHGVIGIVASRIEERFDKPTFIITIEGDEARGSARSFGDFSVYKALDYCSDLLTKYGGHLGAGGFSLKAADIPAFDAKIQEFAQKHFDTMPLAELVADKAILPSEITIENIESLNILQPFGEGSRQPVFAMIGAQVMDITPLSNGLHTKLKVKYGNVWLNVLLFRRSPDELFLKKGDSADIMVTIDTQMYMGKKNISIIAKDIRKHGFEQKKYFAALDAYEKYVRGEQLPSAYYARICPERQELVYIYKLASMAKFSRETLYMTVSDKINYCKLCLCLDIFEELGLIKTDYFTREVTVVKGAPKAELDNSEILQKLKSFIGS